MSDQILSNSEDLDRLIWGAADIAEAANLKDRRQAYHLLARGIIPASRAGGLWVTTLRKIRSVAEIPYERAATPKRIRRRRIRKASQ